MSSIPLPALHVNPPADPLESIQKAMSLKSLMQGQQIQGQQIQENQLKLQQQQQAAQDQQTVKQILGQTQGNVEAALPLLAGKVSPQTLQGLQKFNVEHKESLLKQGKEENELGEARASKLAALTQQASQLPPDQYAQAWPQIAQQALQIEPKLQGHIDPSHPIPQDQLSGLQLGFVTQAQYHAQATAQIAANDEKRKAALFPSQLDKSQKEAAKVGQVPGVDVPFSPEVMAQKKALKPNTNIMTGNDAKDIADAIENGDQPPTLTGLYRNAGPVRAELARRGVPLAKMETDWKATQKYLGTLNGSQQVRLRQAVETASESIDKIDDLYQQLQKAAPTGGFKAWNKGVLATAKQLPGNAGSLATNLEAQIADLTSELGNVYMGGNSPTDHSLSLAGKNLSGDWNKQTFEDAIKQIRLNIKIRQNSITHGAPAGVGNSQYFQGGENSPPAANGPMKITLPSGKQITIE